MTAFFAFETLNKENSSSIFFLKRVLRIYPILILYLGVAFIFTSEVKETLTVFFSLYNSKPFWHVINWNEFYTHLWTISLDFQLYLVIALLFPLIKTITINRLLLLFLGSFFFKIIFTYIFLLQGYQTWKVYLIALYTPLYQWEVLIWAYVLFRYKDKIQTKTYKKLALTSFLILGFFGLYNILYNEAKISDLGLHLDFGLYNPIWLFTVANMLCFSIIGLCLKHTSNEKEQKYSFINDIADIGYPFYLCHYPILKYFQSEFPYTNVFTKNATICLLLSFICTYIIAKIIFIFIEKPIKIKLDYYLKSKGRNN